MKHLVNLEDLPPHVQEAIKGVRYITKACLPSLRGVDGTRQCRWCRAPVQKPRKYWCSRACVDEFKCLQKTPKRIFARDGGKCKVCRVDVMVFQKALNDADTQYKRFNSLSHKLAKRDEIIAKHPDYLDQPFWSSERVSKDISMLELCISTLEDYAHKLPQLFTKMKSGVYKPKYQTGYQVDHIIRVADGGTTTADNLRLLCTFCHVRKTLTEQGKRKEALYGTEDE